MTNSKILQFIIIVSSITIFSSCTAYKKVPYLQTAGNEVYKSDSVFEPKIAINDQLCIIINTTTPEAAVAFNLAMTPLPVTSGTTMNTAPSLQTYLVNTDSTIDFPVLGKIKVVGKTKKEVQNIIRNKIYPKYLNEEPIISIRLINYTISVLGEVAHPGSFVITNERVSLFDALALAGDMTLYGCRDNLLIIREKGNGEKETARINIQDKKVFQSPYYYLRQNDVVYIQPNKHRANASSISSAETITVPIISSLFSLASLIITILR